MCRSGRPYERNPVKCIAMQLGGRPGDAPRRLRARPLPTDNCLPLLLLLTCLRLRLFSNSPIRTVPRSATPQSLVPQPSQPWDAHRPLPRRPTARSRPSSTVSTSTSSSGRSSRGSSRARYVLVQCRKTKSLLNLSIPRPPAAGRGQAPEGGRRRAQQVLDRLHQLPRFVLLATCRSLLID